MNSPNKCQWCIGDPLYEAYHDQEWGVPLSEEQRLFEFLTLETFQAGLSWITILRKREHFRAAFDQFDYTKIARYGPEKVAALLQDKGIVRNRLKVAAAITNAQAFMKVQEAEGSFAAYIWKFTQNRPVQNAFASQEEIPATTPLATTISKDLKQRGFRFVGPTVVYAHLQATGVVNDHETSCFRYVEIRALGEQKYP
jgi:DNA-3-methyladenine glycosylase I